MKPDRPTFRWSVRIARIAGVDVRVHATMLLLLGWVVLEHARTGGMGLLGEGLLLIASVFGLVTLHEFGHVLMARRYGVRTRDVTLLPIGGVSNMEKLPERPREEIAVALAGPMVNVAIAALLLLTLIAAQLVVDVRVLQVVGGPFLAKLMVINLTLAGFNLLPAFPMDGGRVLRAVLQLKRDRVQATALAARVGQVLAFALGAAGLFVSPMLVVVAVFVWMGGQQELAATVFSSRAVKLKVADAMVPVGAAAPGGLPMVEASTPLAEAIEQMREEHASAAVVVDHGQIAGVLTAETVAERLAQEARVRA